MCEAFLAPSISASDFWQGHAALPLIFALAIFVRSFAFFVRLKKEHLGDAFVGVNFGRQRRGIRKLKRHVAFPFGFKGRYVDDDAAARVRAFAVAVRFNIARDAKVFDGARERERVRRDDAKVVVNFNK